MTTDPVTEIKHRPAAARARADQYVARAADTFARAFAAAIDAPLELEPGEPA